MATINKDFKIKNGLIVEGTTGTINNHAILTKSTDDQNYIIGLIGGSATPNATPNTVVLRDANADFSANMITADLTGDVTGTVSDISNHSTSSLTEGTNLYFTVQRALDATASAYDVAGSAAQALSDAEDYTDSAVSSHSNTTSGVHGVTGNVVGTTDAQTLTNKTFGSGTGMSAALDMNGNKIEDLGTPTEGTDATTKNYVDGGDTATLGSANAYTDTREIAITTAYQSYADQAEADAKTYADGVALTAENNAKAYTDTRETAITTAYEAYADQAELDAISSAASAAALLYAPLAGATFTGEVILHSDPTQALGAATKQYVDSVAEGLHVHASVVALADSNISLPTAPASIDGVTLSVNDRVLLTGQTSPAENGIYVVINGDLARAADYNTASEIDPGDFVFVSGGNNYGSTGWVQLNSVTTLGTDPISWDQFSGAGTYTAGTGLTLTGGTFAVDETYTATKSYVDTQDGVYDVLAQGYADQAELDANAYTDGREIAITTAYQSYADQAEADAKTYADGVALTAENNAKAYTDTRETAITTAYQNYADQAEADAKLYTDTEIDALDTDDIEEGTSNLYFTDERAQDAIASAIAAGTQTNISVTYDDLTNSFSFVAENGVGESTTDDLAEGTSNLYFTDERAQDAIASAIAGGTQTNISVTYDDNAGTFSFVAENGVDDSTTDDLDEGTTNLYFTNARAVSALEAVIPNFTEIDINSVATQVAAQVEVPTASTVTAYAFPHADYRSAEFLVKVAYGTHTEISKVILTMDTSNNIAITEYAVVGTNGSASSVTADVDGTNTRLRVTPTNNNSTVTVVGTLLA